MRLPRVTRIILMLVALSSGPNLLDGDVAAATPENPRAVVTRWLELHQTGKRDEASALTTGSSAHIASERVPSPRGTGVRVARSLGNEQAAAVATSSLDDASDSERVLLFWLVRPNGTWRINKSELLDKRVADERLRGFLEAGDVRWHVRRSELLGDWEAGPCRPPGVGGIACGSRLRLGNDNRYRLECWGPSGPPTEGEADDVIQGSWRLDGDQILLSDRDQTYACRVVWMADRLLDIERLDEKGDAAGRATYDRRP